MRNRTLLLEYHQGLPVNDVTRHNVVPVYEHRSTSEIPNYKGEKKYYPVFKGTCLKKHEVNKSVVSLRNIKTLDRATDIFKNRNAHDRIKKATYCDSNGSKTIIYELK